MNNPKRSESIKKFLELNSHEELANQYNSNMEVQVLVKQADGEPVENEFKGRFSRSYTNGVQLWYPFRIPQNADSDPINNDSEMTYDLSDYALGIGMTGWDYVNKKSIYVGFDFDAMIGHSPKHSNKLTTNELYELEEAVSNIPWVTVRYSTSGMGRHIYVYVNEIETINHNEHSALSRAILGIMAGLTNFDFYSKVDVYGSNMWVWHEKMIGTNGLKLIKKGSILENIPNNWRDHISVVSGKRKKSIPTFVPGELHDEFLELVGQKSRIPFDAEHKKLINYLNDNRKYCSYDADHHLIITHTAALKEAYDALKLKGVFETLATGKDEGDLNCFSGDTEILTKEGVKTFKECVNTEQELYVYTYEGMKWIKCLIKSFGVQTTYKMKLGINTSINVTKDHLWLYRKHNSKRIELFNILTTEQLKWGRTELPLAIITLPDKDKDYEKGYAHGFVYGDGSINNTRGKITTTVPLFGCKNDLLPLLSKFGNPGQYKWNNGTNIIYLNCVNQLPSSWKEVPNNITKSYALGFILGLISADGGVYRARSNIFQSDPFELDKIRKLGIYAGLRIRPVKLHSDGKGEGVFPNALPNFTIAINNYNLTENHFIRKDQKQSFSNRLKGFVTTVKYIDWTNPIEEEVFCAEVPIYHNFTLACGVITKNCWMYPMHYGAWAIRRYTKGIQEASTWTHDPNGWTKCYLNKIPDLKTAARICNGLEDTPSGFVFPTAKDAQRAASMLNINIDIPEWAQYKKTKLNEHKDSRLIVELDYDPNGDFIQGGLKGWLQKGKSWKKIFDTPISDISEIEASNFDDIVRHLLTPKNDDAGWTVKTRNGWQNEPINHVTKVLKNNGFKSPETEIILGSCIQKAWRLVNIPFQPEYPGNRQWNRNAAQLRYTPLNNKNYSTWNKLFEHLGKNLDDALVNNKWAKENAIKKGADYLKLWVASLLQHPEEPLPYLFLYGPEDCGKSSLHEALSLLILNGVQRADTALTNQSSFNAELENAILCCIEETDLRKNKNALNLIRDWLIAPTITIHRKGETPYDTLNYMHFIQTANDSKFCPVISGDTRITMILINPLEEKIAKRELFRQLDKEAPDFLYEMLNIEIPYNEDRLAIPIITTDVKIQAQSANKNEIELFIEEACFEVDGAMIKFSEFYNHFIEWIDPNELHNWSKIKVGRSIPPQYPYARNFKDGSQFYIGNLSFENGEHKSRIVLKDGRLVSLAEVKS